MRSFIYERSLTIAKFSNSVKLNSYSTKSLGLWNCELDNSIRHKIEEKWKPKLKKNHYNENDLRPKFYVLSMFPYPSGNLHMGHVRVYTISDTIARFHRMLGKNVFHPMGWDGFGLPAENAAIERKESPKKWTYENIKTMKRQLENLSVSFDWDRELATCHPGYYKFTQYIFLKLYHEGLAYQKESLVNWDPVDNTVLADEQVDEQGHSWRSGAKVEKRSLKQWFIRTTKFAKSLSDGLDDPSLQDWRDITSMQKQWIGLCNGTVFYFKLVGESIKSEMTLTVWTDKAEHISRSKFIAVVPGSLLDKLCEGVGNRKLCCEAVNPVTGDYLPVFVSDNIEYLEGSDSRLGIPDAFESDYVFAKENNIYVETRESFIKDDEENRQRICEEALSKSYGGYLTSARLRDWLISRQRYWGTPIPIVHCKGCGAVPVNFEDLPVLLPNLDLSASKSSGLKQSTDWINTTCPKCNGIAERETDTMDTFVDSSWYYLRYTDPRNNLEPFNKELANNLFPVDIYVGGKEHAVLHLYYARFMSHFLHSIGWLNSKEPFKRMLVQGMVMGKTYRVKGSGKYLKPDEIMKEGKNVTELKTGAPVVEQWEKMSKSKFNGVEPADVLNEYGIDTTRLLILGDVAPTSNRHWNERNFPGVLKWQHRLWLTIKEFTEARMNRTELQKSGNFIEQEEFVWDSRNYYLMGISFNYSVTHLLSSAISKMQGLTGSLRKSSKDIMAFSGEFERALAAQIIVLSPIAPHFASELWAGFQEAPGRINKVPTEIHWEKPVEEQPWPELDPHYNLKLYFMVNNEERSYIALPRDRFHSLTENDAKKLALSDPIIMELLAGYSIKNMWFKLYKNYEATINFFVEMPKQKKVKKGSKKVAEKVS